MNVQSSLRRAGVLLASLVGSVFALSASAAELPRERSAGVASFVSGGVSADQSRAFKQAFHDYPLVIELYERDGGRDVYTADARVHITDAQGRDIVDTQADGPFMLVRLPAGDYTVRAELAGRELPAQAVHLSGHGHADRVFVFPAHTG